MLRLREAGVTVGIGLDGQALADDQDMWAELRLARGLASTPSPAGEALSARALLAMATRAGAAVVMGAAPLLGTIAPGSAADFFALRLDRVRGPYLDARTDLLDAVLGRAKPTDVDTAVVAGEARLRDGRPVGLVRGDIEARLAASLAEPKSPAQETRERLAAALASHLRDVYADW